MEMSGKHNFAGRLFIVEGIDGSVKSTQLSLIHRWLESEGHSVVFSEWNSAPIEEQQIQMRRFVVDALTGTGKTRIKTWVNLTSLAKASQDWICGN